MSVLEFVPWPPHSSGLEGVGFLGPFFSAQFCLDTTPPPTPGLGQQEFLLELFVPPEGREWLPPGMLIA